MTLRSRFQTPLAAVLAILGLVMTGVRPVLAIDVGVRTASAAAQRPSAAMDPSEEAIARLESLRGQILTLKSDRRYGIDVRLRRMIRMLDVLRLQDIEAKRAMLSEMGVVVTRQRVDGQLLLMAKINGRERTLRTDPVPGERLPQVGHETPDGAAVPGPVDELDALEADAEEAEGIDTAYAYSLESEWLTLEAEFAQIVSENGGLSCASDVGESPDGSSGASTAEDCLSYAVTAMMGVGTVLQRVWDKITANGSGLNELRLIFAGLRAQVAAGALTAAAAIDLGFPLVVHFITGLNIGWVLTGVAIAGTGYFVYKMGECYGWFTEPTAIHEM